MPAPRAGGILRQGTAPLRNRPGLRPSPPVISSPADKDAWATVAIRVTPIRPAHLPPEGAPTVRYDTQSHRVWIERAGREGLEDGGKTMLFSSTFDRVCDEPSLLPLFDAAVRPAVQHALTGGRRGTAAVLCTGHGGGAREVKAACAARACARCQKFRADRVSIGRARARAVGSSQERATSALGWRETQPRARSHPHAFLPLHGPGSFALLTHSNSAHRR
jgi:hypothetical protein